MSAISSKADSGSPSPGEPETLVPPPPGSLGERPAESVDQAARLLADIAKLLSPGLTTFETDRESGAKLVQKLDELEVRLRNRGRDGSDSLRAALAGLEAEFRASPRIRATVEPPGQKSALQTGSDGAAERTPRVAGEMASNHPGPSIDEPALGDPERALRRLPESLRTPAMTLAAILAARASIATAKQACPAPKQDRELRAKPGFAIWRAPKPSGNLANAPVRWNDSIISRGCFSGR